MKFSTKVLILCIATVACAAVSLAQAPSGLDSTWKGADMSAIRAILTRGMSRGDMPAVGTSSSKPSSIKFNPVGNSGVPELLGEVFGRNAEERRTLAGAFEQIRLAYKGESAKDGKANDLAAAITFFIAANLSAYQKTAMPSDDATDQLYTSIAAAMSSSVAFSAMSNAEKERMHDWLVIMAGFVATNYEDAKAKNDEAAMATISELAKYSTRLVLGVDIAKLTLVNPPSAGPSTSANGPPAVRATNLSGISKSTTSAGGWTTTVDSEFVRLTNGSLDVYISYPVALSDAQRGDFDKATHFWNTAVVPRFDIDSAVKIEDEVPDVVNWLYHYEGTGTDRRTGKKRFIAMKADNDQGGIFTVIMVVADSKQSYKKAFPNPKGLTHLRNTNRFALTAADVIGTWSNSSGYGLSFVNSDTGRFAGATSTASSHEFMFAPGGRYQSKHSFAKTNFGGTTGGKESHSGSYTVSDWELTVTGSAGTITYEAYFEAVKNGRVLHLTQKGASGNRFSLGLVK